jgi:hypothetical protein
VANSPRVNGELLSFASANFKQAVQVFGLARGWARRLPAVRPTAKRAVRQCNGAREPVQTPLPFRPNVLTYWRSAIDSDGLFVAKKFLVDCG